MAEDLENKEQGQDENLDTDKITITKSELDALLQKEGDRRVSSALKKQESKLKEAARLSQMSAEEKYKYELEQREKELNERENKLALAENKSACVSILVDKGLDPTLVDFVVDVDAEQMNDKIKRLEKAFKASVKREVETRLAGSSPKKNLANDETITKKDLLKMNVRDLQLFKNQNPDTFAQLMKG